MTTAATVLLALTLAATGAPAPAAVLAPPEAATTTQARTAAATDAGTAPSTVELDLSGVERTALDDLPAAAPLPAESVDEGETAAPATADGSPTGDAAPAPDAATPAPATSPEAAPRALGDATAPLTAAPSATPTATPSPAATASAAPTAAPTAPPAAPPATEPTTTPDVLTAPLDTAPFSVLGITWDAAAPQSDDTVVRYRTRHAGEWTDWQAVGPSDVSPDAGSREAGSGRRGATDPIVALDADGVQVWAESASGGVQGLKAVLVDPGTDPDDAAPQAAPAALAGAGPEIRTAADVIAAAPPPPTIITRAQWGADESLRTCEPDLSTEVVAAAVHHTASSASYSADDVPGLIRGFYAYHTRPEAAGGRGWCDIGYNFLVDQFGRVFEGRAGGTDMPIVGVHTGGFNSRTFGVAAIGSFDTVQPSSAMTEAISRTIAWKFALHRIFGSQNVSMVSGGGASKYPAGTVVTFPTIFGHRDAQLTSCPGQRLYDQLPAIRARVSALTDVASQETPFGSWDSTVTTQSSITVTGWFIDPGTSSPITVRLRVDGRETVATADVDRPDVGAAFPGYGSRHGYRVTAPAGAGRHAVCVIGANVGEGSDRMLGCRHVTITNPPPVGQIDSVALGVGTATVTGWARDPDTTDPVDVHVYVDTGATATRANLPRPDLARYFPSTNHGFQVTVRVPAGTHTLCVYPINVPAGDNPALSCRTVVMAANPPVGALDSVALSPGTGQATLSGWARDPDTTSPIDVHVYVDSGGTATRADKPRPDLARYFPTSDHGFDVTVRVPAGQHRVCAYAINVPAGDNPSLGCRVVTMPATPPVGQVDAVAVGADGRTVVSGWARDADATGPIDVHVYVDAGGRATTANLPRPDLARYFPTSDHGFSAVVTVPPGSHRVCAYAINVPAGDNPAIGCRTVTR
ncbi:peptidoglycan recognition protein family protein [Cellulomonas fimi]|uniref:peptidoglycan recognition protein family protein n=1 Tax=Cellulomonas fimi TaxID=1708 RepID=UPI002359F031|nr:N-acetylmuramoyl-L-alanine amidase [Cellulomonas fimi]